MHCSSFIDCNKSNFVHTKQRHYDSGYKYMSLGHFLCYSKEPWKMAEVELELDLPTKVT